MALGDVFGAPRFTATPHQSVNHMELFNGKIGTCILKQCPRAGLKRWPSFVASKNTSCSSGWIVAQEMAQGQGSKPGWTIRY